MKNPWLVLILVALVACSHHFGVEDGQKAFQDGKYQKAISIWLPLADAGNADAAFGLAQVYENASGFANPGEAGKWFRKGAEDGNAFCQYRLAMKTDDPVEATEWLRRAAVQGMPAAMDWLWQAYLSGKGVPQDYAEAYFWALQVKARNGPVTDHDLDWLKWQLGPDRSGECQRRASESWMRIQASRFHR